MAPERAYDAGSAPCALAPPAISKASAAGTGNPIASRNTAANRITKPCAARFEIQESITVRTLLCFGTSDLASLRLAGADVHELPYYQKMKYVDGTEAKLLRCAAPILAAALVFFISDVVLARPKPASDTAEDQRLLPYVEPGQLVDIGGRRINPHCTGSGAPTVVLMAGISSWSPVWYKTQPVIAQKTRVCAFDRASFGFSDPAPRPQILSDTVNDLHAALEAAPIP